MIPSINIENSLKIIEAGSEIDTKWENFISKNSESTIYHHPEWFKALKSEYNQEIIRLVCQDKEGEIKGVMPITFTKGFPFGLGGLPAVKRLSSLPRTPIGGPISFDEKAKKLLLEAAVQKLKEKKDYTLQIKSMDPKLNELVNSLVALPWRLSYIKNLPNDPEKLRFGNSRNHSRIKWSINKAIKSGVEIKCAESEEELKKWFVLYNATMRWHVVPSRSYRFFKGLWDSMKPKGLMTLLLAVQKNAEREKILAGSVILKYNKTVFYAFNGRDENELAHRPNELIQWHAMNDSINEGYSVYDLGEVASDNEGLDKFKSKWDCEIQQLYHYYYPRPMSNNYQNMEIDIGKFSNIKKSIWQNLPLGVTTKISDLVYRYL